MEQEYVHPHSKLYALSSENILNRLKSDGSNGLTVEEAAKRLRQFGSRLRTH